MGLQFMNIFECLRVALRGLASNKMRTMLTMLGIIIGVGVVILVVAIGQGASKRVQHTINALATTPLAARNGQTCLPNLENVSKAAPTATGASRCCNRASSIGSSKRLKIQD